MWQVSTVQASNIFSLSSLREASLIISAISTRFMFGFIHFQLIFTGFVTMTLFLRTEMHRDTETDGGIYMGALFFILIVIMFNGYAELSMFIVKLPVFYKQRDLLFFPAWAYSLPTWILKIPITFVEVGIWVGMTYYVIGFDPSFER